MALIGQFRHAFSVTVLETQATSMGGKSERSAWCEEILPKSHG